MRGGGASGGACTAQMDNPRIFPQQYGEPFPPDFQAVVRTVFKRLFRVYAHLYHSHFRHVCSLGEEAHLNTCFKHFVSFTQARSRGCSTPLSPGTLGWHLTGGEDACSAPLCDLLLT